MNDSQHTLLEFDCASSGACDDPACGVKVEASCCLNVPVSSGTSDGCVALDRDEACDGEGVGLSSGI